MSADKVNRLITVRLYEKQNKTNFLGDFLCHNNLFNSLYVQENAQVQPCTY